MLTAAMHFIGLPVGGGVAQTWVGVVGQQQSDEVLPIPDDCQMEGGIATGILWWRRCVGGRQEPQWSPPPRCTSLQDTHSNELK